MDGNNGFEFEHLYKLIEELFKRIKQNDIRDPFFIFYELLVSFYLM